ncbi:MAG TPA: NAD(P)-dependent alcohol dehydrogenase [Dehalococcoidia bacterium]|nr:NAD(P)-dependent alcohol dehydrogenase [Dehalococcoidia bacterium]
MTNGQVSVMKKPTAIAATSTMKAARIHQYGQPLVVEEVPRPTPGHGQILVKVVGAGFCHSDLHVMDGEIPILPRLPLTLGHENAGVVAEVGEGVSRAHVGENVAIFGGWGCGHCDYCVSGREQMCETPAWAGLSEWDGGYAEYILVPDERHLVPLGDLDPRIAAPLTDAALTPYRAIHKALPFIEPDHKVLVIGIGGLGQYCVKLLRILTGAEIIAVDVSQARLELAKELGAAAALLAPGEELSREIREMTHGGVGAAFDIVGSESSLALALSATRAGGKVTQLGLAGGTARLKVMETNPWEVTFEATIWGTVRELREVVALVRSGRLAPIATEFVPLDAINEAHDRLKRGQVEGRLVVTP